MSDVRCPYCNSELIIRHDDGEGYEEDKPHQQQCKHCDKYFVYTTSIHFYYEAAKADCLNDGEHKWKKTLTYPPEYARLRCEDCGEEKPIPKAKP